MSCAATAGLSAASQKKQWPLVHSVTQSLPYLITTPRPTSESHIRIQGNSNYSDSGLYTANKPIDPRGDSALFPPRRSQCELFRNPLTPQRGGFLGCRVYSSGDRGEVGGVVWVGGGWREAASFSKQFWTLTQHISRRLCSSEN